MLARDAVPGTSHAVECEPQPQIMNANLIAFISRFKCPASGILILWGFPFQLPARWQEWRQLRLGLESILCFFLLSFVTGLSIHLF